MPKICIFSGATDNLKPIQVTLIWDRKSFQRPSLTINYWVSNKVNRLPSYLLSGCYLASPGFAVWLGMHIHWLSAIVLTFMGIGLVSLLISPFIKRLSILDYRDGVFKITGASDKFIDALESGGHFADVVKERKANSICIRHIISVLLLIAFMIVIIIIAKYAAS